MMNSIQLAEYVATHAETSACRSVMESGSIFITGKTGSGKTTCGLRILTKVSEKTKRKPMLLISPQQWQMLPLHSQKQEYVIMIDDIFGDSNFVMSYAEDWGRIFEIIFQCIQNGQVLLILTSRTEVYRQCPKSIRQKRLIKCTFAIPIDESHYALTRREMERLLQTYCKSHLQAKDISEIADSGISNTVGFPLLCKRFSENPSVHHNGVSFFHKEKETILDELKILKKEDEIGYYTLLLVLFKDSCLKHDFFNSMTSEESKCFLEETRQFSIMESVPTMCKIYDTAKRLCGIYLHQSNAGFHFQHQSILEAVVLSMAEFQKGVFISKCPLQTFIEFIRLEQNNQELGENSINIPIDSFKTLALRVTTLLLQRKRAADILRHPCFSDKNFVKVLLDIWSQMNIFEQELDHKVIYYDTFNMSIVNTYEPYANLDKLLTVKPLFHYNYLLSHIIMILSILHVDLKFIIKKMDLSKKLRIEALSCAIYRLKQDWVDILSDEGKLLPKCLSILIYVNKMNELFTRYSLHSYMKTEPYQNLLSIAIQARNTNAVQMLVKDRTLSNTNKHFYSNCLTMLLLQSCGEIRGKPQYTSSASAASDIEIILKELFISDFAYDTMKLVCLASSHDDVTALKFLLEAMRKDTIKLNDHNSLHFQLACQYGAKECVVKLVYNGTNHNIAGISKRSCPSAFPKRYSGEGIQQQLSLEKGHQRKHNTDVYLPGCNEHLHLAAKSHIDGYEKVQYLCFLSERKTCDRSYCAESPLLRNDFQIGRTEFVNRVDSNGCTALHYAAIEGDLKTTKLLLLWNARVTYKDYWGLKPLSCAVLGKNTECVRDIWEAETEKDVDAAFLAIRFAIGYPPPSVSRYYGIRRGKHDPHYLEEIFKIFPKHVFDSRFFYNALSHSVEHDNEEAIVILLQLGANINTKNNKGETVLHLAARLSDFKMVKFLCNNESDVTALDKVGMTVLHHAAKSELDAIDKIEYLLERIKQYGRTYYYVDINGQTPLFSAVQAGNFQVIECLLHHRQFELHHLDFKGQSLLHVACNVRERLQILALMPLFKMGMDIYLQDRQGRNPLDVACENNNSVWIDFLSPMYNTLKQDNEDTRNKHKTQANVTQSPTNSRDQKTRYVNEFSPNPNYNNAVCRLQDSRGNGYAETIKQDKTLPCYSETDYINWVETKLQEGAYVSQVDELGRTALHYTAKGSNTELLQLLLKYSTDCSVQDSNGQTPVHLAAINGQWKNLGILITSDADINISDNHGFVPLHYAALRQETDTLCVLLKNEAKSSVENCKGQTPVHLSVKHGKCKHLELFMKPGVRADINIKDNNGCVPLHYAANHEETDALYVLLQKQNHADLNVKNSRGQTPVHISAMNQRYEHLKLLIEFGADVNIRDERNCSPLDYAVEHKYDQIIQLLKEPNQIQDSDSDNNCFSCFNCRRP